MAYRSWLKDVKTIHDLGAHCHNLSFRSPEDDARIERYEEKWRARFNAPIPVQEEYQYAFRSGMHDSWVEWIKRSPGELRIRINNDLCQHFVGQICKMLDIHIPTFLNTTYDRDIDKSADIIDWIAPVDLVFEDPIYVNAVRQELEGKLRWSGWENAGRQKPFQADQFLYDWFFEQDGRIQCIAAIWSRRPGSKVGDTLYLLVDCSRARAEDGREQAIKKLLGPGAAAIWNDFQAGVDIGDSQDKWTHAYAYIERRMEARGLKLQDLRPRSEKSLPTKSR